LPQIIENFKSFIPADLLLTIPPSAIAELIDNILSFREGDGDAKDILNEIIANSLEQFVPVSENYSHAILSDILRQTLSTLHISDVGTPDAIDFIGVALKDKPGIDASSIDVGQLLDEILDFATDNLTEDLDAEAMREILESIIAKI
jgi:hypothetical protein